MISGRKKKGGVAAFLMIVVLIFFYFCLPAALFEDPYSTVLEDRHGNLLSAAIAADGQWRFPQKQFISAKYKTAVIAFEDKRFESHWGVDFLAISRAVRQNFRAGRVISGGSTISMQVIRLSRKGKTRSFSEKIIEMVMALRLELRYTKAEIFSLYQAHAPFGGNVVGLESACWRYFSRNPGQLSWAEAALLAVLPNNPSLIHPGKNRARLKIKRDGLLSKLKDDGTIDKLSYDLAVAEPVPEKPTPLPDLAPHFLDRMSREGRSQERIVSTIDVTLQQRAAQILNDHHRRLKGNQIFNAAALVLEVKTGNVIAYIGNTDAGKSFQEDVDVVNAPRSTGSILKPFLFAAMLDEGKMLQKTLMPDVPVTINGFSPKNFSHEYDGAVPADQALIRSLNIPVVNELREYRYEKFYEVLKHVGITTLKKPADHYGLTLVLGGAEGTLWDITGAYASMARTLTGFFDHVGKNKYLKSDFHSPVYDTISHNIKGETPDENSFLSAASIWLTFETLKEVYRPGEEAGWRYFNASKKIAWKTGTSFGFRDGWAVGVTPDYAVGVWVGNADGEGRPGLTGTETAAPVMFDLFALLPGQAWFRQPTSEMEKIMTCSKSGQRAGELCVETELSWTTHAGMQTPSCQYHKRIHLSPDERFQVHSGCMPVDQMTNKSWFVLPPVQEYYFKTRNLSYHPLPPFRHDCTDPAAIASMDLVYPKPASKIYIPRELDGKLGSTVFELAHRSSTATVYWHLDDVFIGSTKKSHHLPVSPSHGKHVLTVVDEFGETLTRNFSVLSAP